MYSTASPTFVEYGIKTIKNYAYIHYSRTRPSFTQLNTPTVQPKLGVKPTSPIPIPKNVHTSAAQVSVTDADNLTSVSPTAREMFFHGEARKCYEEAGEEEKEDEKLMPKPERPTTLPVKPQKCKQAREVPQTSATMVGSTCTVTVSSSSGETTTTTTGDKTADGPTNPETFQYIRKGDEKKSGAGIANSSHYLICTNRNGRGPDQSNTDPVQRN